MVALRTSGKLFRAAMNNRAANLRIGTERRIIRMCKIMHQELVANTPILTGKAKAEWQVSLNSEPTQELLPRTRPPSQVDYDTYAEAAVAHLDTYKSGDIIYISSVIPYIDYLNAGGSQQAPAGFVEDAEATALAALRATV